MYLHYSDAGRVRRRNYTRAQVLGLHMYLYMGICIHISIYVYVEVCPTSGMPDVYEEAFLHVRKSSGWDLLEIDAVR